MSKSIISMSDAQLLSSVIRVSENKARYLLTQHGSLSAMSNGVLSSVMEVAKRTLFENIQRGDALCSPAATRQFLRAQLMNCQHEVFAALFLDNRNRVISFDRMFNGTIDGASVYPREVVRAAINHNAAAVIFAHNHPSGVAEPSHADEQITKRLKEALALIDVRVLDHFVVGDEVVSFAERGLL